MKHNRYKFEGFDAIDLGFASCNWNMVGFYGRLSKPNVIGFNRHRIGHREVFRPCGKKVTELTIQPYHNPPLQPYHFPDYHPEAEKSLPDYSTEFELYVIDQSRIREKRKLESKQVAGLKARRSKKKNRR